VPKPSNSIPPDARAALAQRQAALVRALARADAVPDQFDPMQIQIASAALTRKRKRGIEKTWPGLSAAIEDHFADYAAQTPLNAQGPETDGLRFALWLGRHGQLPGAGQMELAAHRAARGFPLRLVVLPKSRRIVVLYRIRRTVRWWPKVPSGLQ
jgi:hypothetical protein